MPFVAVTSYTNEGRVSTEEEVEVILLFSAVHPFLELLSSSSNLLVGHSGRCDKLSRPLQTKRGYLICVPSICLASAVVMMTQYVYANVCIVWEDDKLYVGVAWLMCVGRVCLCRGDSDDDLSRSAATWTISMAK